MAAVAEEAKVKVKLRQSIAGIGWSAEKGDEIAVPLADARRMVARGVAEELKDAPLPKATKDEAAAAAVMYVETAGFVPRLDNRGEQKTDKQGNRMFHNSNRVLTRPAKLKPAEDDD